MGCALAAVAESWGHLHALAQAAGVLLPGRGAAPETPLGRGLEALLVSLRYALVIVPAGIVAAELRRRRAARQDCPACAATGHAADAAFCTRCGGRLPAPAGSPVVTQRPTVLVIDDEPRIRPVGRHARDGGVDRVLEAGTAREG